MLTIMKQFLTEQEEKKDDKGVPACEKGYQWCPIKKKCVPIGSGDGKGPRKKSSQNERREVVKEPPVGADGPIEIEKIKTAQEAVDRILNAIGEEENNLDNKPKETPEEEMDALKSELAEALNRMNKLLNESKYQVFFKSMLKKFGVTSPAQLKGAKKKAFFNAVDKGWTGEKK